MARKKAEKFQVAKDITLSKTNHEKLLNHVMERMELAKDLRDRQAEKFAVIDKAVYGYLVLEEGDQKRENDNEKGYGIKPVEASLPLTLTSLDEATTFLLEVIQNDAGLYSAIAAREEHAVATAFSAVMNENAMQFSHITEVSKFLFDALKYNFSGLIPSWHRVHGNKITNNQAKTAPDINAQIVYAGNKLDVVDVYNFFYDSSVSPIKLASEGEFFATCETATMFRLKKRTLEKELFNTEGAMSPAETFTHYYRARPAIRANKNTNENTDFVSMLSQGAAKESVPNNEVIQMLIWINPKQFGLSNDDTFEIWRLRVLNSTRVVYAEKMNNAHGMLPIGISMPWEDGFTHDTKSYAELLNAFQTFASFQMNVMSKSHRKALYGLLFYNKNVVDLDDNYDPTGGKIPVNAPPDADLTKALRFVNDTPDTGVMLNNISAMADMMQKVLPTDILRQVAGLERATQYQSAATVQGANRRNLKIARIIYDQGLNVVNRMQMYNILQYQQVAKLITPDGYLIEINPAEFRDTQLEFQISEGLQGLDKLSMIMSIKEVLNSILQSQQASQQLDVTAIINYWTSMLGDRTDFSQFKFKSEIDKLPPEQKDLAFQLLQTAMQEQQGGDQTAVAST